MSERTVDEAAYWMMVLHSGQVTDTQLKAFEAWVHSDPRHAQVFQRLSDSAGNFQAGPVRQLGSDRVIDALNTPSSRRQVLRGGAGLLALVGGSLLGLRLMERGFSLPGDLTTGVAERRAFLLDDGSRLTLDARSRVTPRFDADSHSLIVHQGSLLLQKPRDSAPLLLQSLTGQLALAGDTHLLLDSRSAGYEHVTLLQGRARLHTADGGSQWLEKGQNARYSNKGLLALGRAQESASAWLEGLLQVENRPLVEVIEALRAYRPGVLRITPAAAAMHVSGIYPLDNSDRALSLLQRSLPIRVTRFSNYWVNIEPLV